MTSFAVLLSQKAELEAKAQELNKQIEEAKREERKAIIAQIKSLMADNGLTTADLEGAPGKRAAKAGSGTGKKVAPKYRHPKTGQEWTGRGITPNWLKAELDSGKKLESFLIKH